jgi:hypothetical protein
MVVGEDAICKELDLPLVPNDATLQQTYAKMRKLDLIRMRE